MKVSRVRAEPGPSFAHDVGRPRIAGVSRDVPGASDALAAVLGGSGRALSGPVRLVVDADACSFEGKPLETEQDWWDVVRTGAYERVDGGFALAVRSEQGLHLVRDAIGHRTLYYARANQALWFASSLRALLSLTQLPRRLNRRAVAAFLSYAYVPGRETMIEGAYELLPGEQVRFEQGELVRRSYWQVPAEPTSYAPAGELEAELRRTLEQTVLGMLPHTGAVAASLSGGIDSSLVVALASKLHRAPVRTFSITFGAEYRDELPWSSLVAEHCQTQHTVLELTPASIIAHLDDTMACLDKPNGDPLTVPNALLFRQMRQVAVVALNGEGGDPCFGGPKNVPMVLSELYGDDDERPLGRERNYLRAHLKCFDELDQLLTEESLAPLRGELERELSPWFGGERWPTLVGRLTALNIYLKGGHHILPKVDALSAPFGVLPRSPLFARSLVELSCRIPSELKLRGSVEKYVLKRAVAGLLPQEVVDRPKSGMMVPVEAWFRGPLLAQARERIIDGLGSYGIFRRQYLDAVVKGRLGGLRPRHGVKTWLLVSLEAHLRALGIGSRRGAS